jgi:hypothetical protein
LQCFEFLFQFFHVFRSDEDGHIQAVEAGAQVGPGQVEQFGSTSHRVRKAKR